MPIYMLCLTLFRFFMRIKPPTPTTAIKSQARLVNSSIRLCTKYKRWMDRDRWDFIERGNEKKKKSNWRHVKCRYMDRLFMYASHLCRVHIFVGLSIVCCVVSLWRYGIDVGVKGNTHGKLIILCERFHWRQRW